MLVERHARKAAAKLPSLGQQARAWPAHDPAHDSNASLAVRSRHQHDPECGLGDASLATTNVYAEVDLEMKAKALETCEIKEEPGWKAWRQNAGVMEFLRNL